jgi:hypothetical protein
LDFSAASAAASLFNATAEARDRFWINRYGPSHRQAQNASAALRIFVRHPKKTFATISSRKQTSIGRRRKVGFLDLIPKSLRTNQEMIE